MRTRVTISSFTGPRGWRFAVWLLNPEMAQPVAARPAGSPGAYAGPSAAPDAFLGWGRLSAVDTLTRREKDVLQLLLDGRRVSSIAQDPLPQPPDGPQPPESHLPQVGGTFSGRVAR